MMTILVIQLCPFLRIVRRMFEDQLFASHGSNNIDSYRDQAWIGLPLWQRLVSSRDCRYCKYLPLWLGGSTWQYESVMYMDFDFLHHDESCFGGIRTTKWRTRWKLIVTRATNRLGIQYEHEGWWIIFVPGHNFYMQILYKFFHF